MDSKRTQISFEKEEEGGNKKRRVEEDQSARKDLGRLLLRTSKRMSAFAFPTHDDIWKSLCFNEWGNPADTSTLIERTGLSAENCFRKIALDKDTRRHVSAPRILQYSPEDYLLIVTLRVGAYSESHGRFLEKVPIFKTIKGEEIVGFFQTGEARASFDDPLWKHILDDDDDDGVSVAWDASVQIMRLPDKRIVNLGSLGESDYVEPSQTNGGECEVEWGGGWSRFPPHMSTSYGLPLLSHFFLSHDEISFEIDLDYRTTSTTDNAVAFGIFGFHLYAMLSSNSEEDYERSRLSHSRPVREGRVTYAHFLEALDAWSD